LFDIGFSEIVVCAIVALVVIGPERMPEAVRTVGLWIGRVKRSLRETRSEIERQIGVDDIRRQLHNEEIMQSLENARRDMDRVIAETQESLTINHEYQSEPDLPYHSHMEENAEKAAELPAPDAADLIIEHTQDSAKVTTLADQTPINNSVTSDKKASL
jgi:sec-independent protein translocase protein TatB